MKEIKTEHFLRENESKTLHNHYVSFNEKIQKKNHILTELRLRRVM